MVEKGIELASLSELDRFQGESMNRNSNQRNENMSQWYVVAVCILCEMVLLVVQRLVVPISDKSYGALHNGLMCLALGGALMCCSIALAWRYEHPIIVLVLESIAIIPFSYIGLDSWISPLLLIAYYAYSLTALRDYKILITGLWAAFSMLIPLGFAMPSKPFIEILPRLISVIMVGLLAFIMRYKRELRISQEREALEQQRSALLVVQRDAASKRNDIATELHDSVGHGLTTIIALSQGIQAELLDDAEYCDVNEAISAIHEVATTCLRDTRIALHSLSEANIRESGSSECQYVDEVVDASRAKGVAQLHQWNDIQPILLNIRRSGIITTLSEMGYRSTDSKQADLCFVMTREAITNALRHGKNLSHIAISWNHNGDGSMTISIANDEDTPQISEDSIGFGLTQMRRRVEAVGGKFHAGYDANIRIWKVMAYIPAVEKQVAVKRESSNS